MRPTPVMPRRPRAAQRTRLYACVLMLMLLLLPACSSTAHVPPHPTATATPSPTATATPSATPIPGPLPAIEPLSAPPSSCPATQAPQTLDFPNGFGSYSGGIHLVGGAMVWIPAPSFPTVVHLEPRGATSWPTLAIVWELGPDASEAVSVQATNTQTGAVLWWVHGAPPDLASQTLVLDADVPGPAIYTGVPAAGWQEFESSLLIPQAGCYALTASWAGGSWHVVFAAGA